MGVALKEGIEEIREKIESIIYDKVVTTITSDQAIERLVALFESPEKDNAILKDEWKRELNTNCGLLEEREQYQAVCEAAEAYLKAYDEWYKADHPTRKKGETIRRAKNMVDTLIALRQALVVKNN